MLSASSCLALSPLLDEPLSCKTTPASPKGTPGVAQSDSHYAEAQVRFPFTCTLRAASGAALSTQGNASLAVSFRIYTRSSEQARSEYKPHLQR